MPRGADTWPSLGAAVARVLALPPPAWVRPATVAQVAAALAMLRADALAAVVDEPTRTAPRVLAMGRTLYMAARAPGGWLSATGASATLAEVRADARPSRPVGRPRST